MNPINQFIQHSTFGTKSMRKILLKDMYNALVGKNNALQSHNRATESFSCNISKIIDHDIAKQLFSNNALASTLFLEKLIRFIEETKADLDCLDLPYITESYLLNRFIEASNDTLEKEWPIYEAFLKKTYVNQEMQLNFYKTAFPELPICHKFKARFIEHWTEAFLRRKTRINNVIIEQKAEEFIKNIEEEERQKYQKLNKTIAPHNDIMNSFCQLKIESECSNDTPSGDNNLNCQELHQEEINNLLSKLIDQARNFTNGKEALNNPQKNKIRNRHSEKNNSFGFNEGLAKLSRYFEFKQHEKEILDFAKKLGKSKRASDYSFQKSNGGSEKTYLGNDSCFAQKSEIIGFHLGSDLNSLSAMEVALLADETTEDIFIKKFAEQKLINLEYNNRYFEKSNQLVTARRNRTKGQQNGPVIMCCDTSGSMRGDFEIFVKGIAMAIAKEALKAKRKCFIVNFSVGIRTFEITRDTKTADLEKFMLFSFNGGTNPAVALTQTANLILSKEYERADVLMMSDFIMAQLPSKTIKQFDSCKANGTLFWTLEFGQRINQVVVKQFDNRWKFDKNAKREDKKILFPIK